MTDNWDGWNSLPEDERFQIQRQKFTEYMRGDMSAVVFLEDVFSICHVWDDLIDKDKPVTDEMINQAFIKSLLDIPSNSFYRAHETQIRDWFLVFINQWLDANKFEKEKKNSMYSFVLKDTLADLIALCAYIVSGDYAYMRTVSEEVKAWQIETQNYLEYKSRINDRGKANA